jgi:hypothetical protein
MEVGHFGSLGPGLQNQPGGSIGMHAGPNGGHDPQTHWVPSLNAQASPISASVHVALGAGFSPGHEDADTQAAPGAGGASIHAPPWQVKPSRHWARGSSP